MSFTLSNGEAEWRDHDYAIVATYGGEEALVLLSGSAVLAPGKHRRIRSDVELPAPLTVDDVEVRVVGCPYPLPFDLESRPFAVSVVIPALNEELGLARVLQEVPIRDLNAMGYVVEILVVDNGSTDRTRYIAHEHGVSVIVQPVRGYGNAYKAGFANATGDIIVTGDADCTYPFEALPDLIERLETKNLDFVNTNRLSNLDPEAMSRSHRFGNWLLSAATRVLFGWPFRDSQSGMWVFRAEVLDTVQVRSAGMPFSQELKIRAFRAGLRCDEVDIEYRARAGEEKLNTIRDGIRNVCHLAKLRLSR